MRNLAAPTILGIILCVCPLQLHAAELPLSVQLDLLEQNILEHLRNQQPLRALHELDSYLALAALPPPLSFIEARIAVVTGDMARTEAALQRYFNALGDEADKDQNYAEALALYRQVAPLAEAQRIDARQQVKETLLARKRELAGDLGERAIWDCDHCPVLASIPAGQFQMGGRKGKPEESTKNSLQHRVRVAAFALGVVELTVGEWQAFIEATGYRAGSCFRHLTMADEPDGSWQDPGFPQGVDQPVVCISWLDAQAYVAWLRELTGKPYRLPSEAEWEYAARAGTTTAYFWGEEPTLNSPRCNGCGSAWDKQQSAPVASFPANAFGLYDLHGNVREWVQDCYHLTYRGAPGDSRVWDTDCLTGIDSRMIRGGSFYNFPFPEYQPYSATREFSESRSRHSSTGVRIARDHDAD